ncbi:hypothetical protein GW17_00045347 [Ensete ventricosum]|nr:hypothetical protein GW17_00045347 [Ensete ventricosum]
MGDCDCHYPRAVALVGGCRARRRRLHGHCTIFARKWLARKRRPYRQLAHKRRLHWCRPYRWLGRGQPPL